jgi:hypothetical protein
MTTLRPWIQLVLVLAAATGIRAWLILHTDALAVDSPQFIEMARAWTARGAASVTESTFHPGYPVALAAMHRLLASLWGDGGPAQWALSGQIVSLLFGVAATAGVWFFAGRVFGGRVAWVASLLFGLARPWAALGADVLTDPPSVCFQVWAAGLSLVVLDHLARRSVLAVAWAAVVGVCIGLGYLCRPEAMLMVLPVAVAWLIRWSAAPGDRRLTLASLAAMPAAALACAAPYMLAIGGFTQKKSVADFVMRVPAEQGVTVAHAGLSGAHLEGLWLVLRNLSDALHPLLAGLVGLWLVVWILGRVFHWRIVRESLAPLRPEGLLLAVGILAVLTPFLVGQYATHQTLSHRYLMVPAALLAALAGSMVVRLPPLAAPLLARVLRRRPATPSPLIATALALALAAGLAAHSLRPLHEGKQSRRDAAPTQTAAPDIASPHTVR